MLAKDVLLKFIKSRGVLVTVTLIYCYIVNFLTAGGQTVAIIVTEQTFEDAFDRMGIHRRVLSRTLEDAGTLSAPIVPWGVATLYVMEVLAAARSISRIAGSSSLYPSSPSSVPSPALVYGTRTATRCGAGKRLLQSD